MIARGLALAIPSNTVESFLKGNARPYLGVTMRPVLLQLEKRQVLGLLVLEVAFGSLAMSAGLLKGDIIIGVCGQKLRSPDDLTTVLWHSKPGELLLIEFLREGQYYCRSAIVGNTQPDLIPLKTIKG